MGSLVRFFRLGRRIRDAAWSGTRWIFSKGKKYGIHETTNALMHLELCRKLYPTDTFLSEIRTGVRNWFHQKTLSALLEFRSPHYSIPISTRLILLSLFAEYEMTDSPCDNSKVIRSFALNFKRVAPKIRQLDRAADYWVAAYGLKLHGYEVDTRCLRTLQVRLPPVRIEMDVESGTTVGAFNYCTHLVLCETRHLHRVQPELATLPCVRWLGDLWRKTRMRDDIEYLAEFLNCIGATGGRLPRDDVAYAILAILDSQGATGCWRGSKETSRYERFHTAWCATEALHLSSRLL